MSRHTNMSLIILMVLSLLQSAVSFDVAGFSRHALSYARHSQRLSSALWATIQQKTTTTKPTSKPYARAGSSGGAYKADEKEFDIRGALIRKEWNVAEKLIGSLNTTKFASGRTVMFVIVETCRRNKSLQHIIPLLEAIPVNLDGSSSWDDSDIMPLLSDAAVKKTMRQVWPVVDYFTTKQRVRLSLKAHSIAINGFGKLKDEVMVTRQLQMYLDNLASANFKQQEKEHPDVILLNSVMDAYIRCSNTKLAVNLFILATKPNPDIFGTIDQSIRSGRSMNKQRAAEEARILSAWSDVFAHKADYASIGATAVEYIQPNVRTFNIFLRGVSTNYDICLEVLYKMKEVYRIPPDQVTVNTVIDACVEAGDLVEAERLLNDYSSLLTTTATTTTINNDKRFGADKRTQTPRTNTNTEIDTDTAATRKTEAAPGVEAFSSVIAGLADRGDADGAFRVLRAMESTGVRPNGYTLSSLMHACITTGRVSRATTLLRQYSPRVFSDYDGGNAAFVPGSVASAGSLGSAVVVPSVASSSLPNPADSSPSFAAEGLLTNKRGGSDQDKQQKEQRGKTPPPSPASQPSRVVNLVPADLTALHGTYVSGLCRLFVSNMNKLRAADTFSSIINPTANTNTNTNTNTIIPTYTSSNDYDNDDNRAAQFLSNLYLLRSAHKELLHMDATGIAPDIALVNAFIKATCLLDSVCGQRNRVRDCLRLVSNVVALHVTPDAYTYSILFKELGRVGYIDEALSLFKGVVGSEAVDVDMDNVAINSLIAAFSTGNAPERALLLFAQLVSPAGQLKKYAELYQFVPDKVTFTTLFVAVLRDGGSEGWDAAGQDAGYGKGLGLSGIGMKGVGIGGVGRGGSGSVGVQSGLGSDIYRYAAYEDEEEEDRFSFGFDGFLTGGGDPYSYGGPGYAKPLSSSAAAAAAGGGSGGRGIGSGSNPVADRVRATIAEIAALPLPFARSTNGQALLSTDPPSPSPDTSEARQKGEGGTREARASVVEGARVASASASASAAVAVAAATAVITTITTAAAASTSAVDAITITTANPTTAPSTATPSTSTPSTDYEALFALLLDARDYDRLLAKLFKMAIFEFCVEPDEVMVGTLNSLLSDRFRGQLRISKTTARLIFEELIAAGFHPSQMEAILRSAGYSGTQVSRLLSDAEALTSLRAYVKSSSSRLFKKYGWNTVKSGFFGI